MGQEYLGGLHCGGGEPTADILVRYSMLHGTTIGGSLIPALIDEIPMIAVMAACAEGTTVIKAFILYKIHSILLFNHPNSYPKGTPYTLNAPLY